MLLVIECSCGKHAKPLVNVITGFRKTYSTVKKSTCGCTVMENKDSNEINKESEN